MTPAATLAPPATATDRITAGEALELLRTADTADLMDRAHRRRLELHGLKTFFVNSTNLNPTNLCELDCQLCAFYRKEGDPAVYQVNLEEARSRFRKLAGLGLTELHVVGGLHKDFGLEYHEALFRIATQELPGVLIQGLTAVEIDYFSRLSKLPLEAVLTRLKEAGLGGMPGGGAEIFAGEVRAKICPTKISGKRWLRIHEIAHGVGLRTNVTMLFGHVERDEHIVDHMLRVRELQDMTGGFQSFIPLPFHPDGTRVEVARKVGGHRIARVVALARLFLDNVPHIRVLPNYMDIKLIQVLTHSGADDVGGVSMDERIASAAGAPTEHCFSSVDHARALLTDIGLEPVLTNSQYHRLQQATIIQPPTPARLPAVSVEEALAVAAAGDRVSHAQAVALHDHAPFQQLGRIAHTRRLKTVPGNVGTFVLDRNISITNVCEVDCLFCAFYERPETGKGYVVPHDVILKKVQEAEAMGATQVLIQGGLNPALTIEYYEEAFRILKAKTGIWIHSLSPAEICFFAQQEKCSLEAVLLRLKKSGLDSIPGGGAEILVDDVRKKVSRKKTKSAEWLEVMRTAHRVGLKTTATMVYGLGENSEQRVEHMIKLRELQDETGGFTAFIPWSYQPGNAPLKLKAPHGIDYLRIMALARIVIDNIPHFQAGWLTEGADLCQLALAFGADDFGGVLMEEKVIRATGKGYTVTAGEVVPLIHETGMDACQRTTQYAPVKHIPNVRAWDANHIVGDSARAH